MNTLLGKNFLCTECSLLHGCVLSAILSRQQQTAICRRLSGLKEQVEGKVPCSVLLNIA